MTKLLEFIKKLPRKGTVRLFALCQSHSDNAERNRRNLLESLRFRQVFLRLVSARDCQRVPEITRPPKRYKFI